MRRGGLVLAVAVAVLGACSGDRAGEHDGAGPADAQATVPDAARSDAAMPEAGPNDAVGLDAGMDAAVSSPDAALDAAALDAASDAVTGDAMAIDARASAMCAYLPESCTPEPYPDWIHCEAPTRIEPGTTLTMQDTAAGGYGDCASSASGAGGPRLYYAVLVPPARTVRVIVRPMKEQPEQVGVESALLRMLSDCYASQVDLSDRGGALTEGRAGLCVDNDTSEARSALVAVSQYSGEAQCSPLRFEISAQLIEPDQQCPPGAFDDP